MVNIPRSSMARTLAIPPMPRSCLRSTPQTPLDTGAPLPRSVERGRDREAADRSQPDAAKSWFFGVGVDKLDNPKEAPW